MKKLNYLFVGILFGLMLIGPAGAQDASDAQPVEKPLPQGVLSGASVPEFTEESEGKSANEIAKELANPNNSLASLTFKNQFRWYTGDLPNADEQSNYTLLFQPIFPFALTPPSENSKATFFLRPAFPLLVDQPVFDPLKFDFKDVTAMGDIGFDVGYGVNEKSGFLWAFGMVGTLPTATDDDVGGEQLRLGPEVLIASFEKWGIWGFFPYHQWNVTGGDEHGHFSTSQLQLFLISLPGGGWSVGTRPIINYDWEEEEWTVPLNLAISKTVLVGKMPLKWALDMNYYVEQPDLFGPEWMIGIEITPVVPNIFERLIRGS